MEVASNEEWVRLLLALGALGTLAGAGLQAKAELIQYKDVVTEASLTDAQAQELLGPYFSLSYLLKLFGWSLVPFYGIWIVFLREPRKLIEKLINSALPEVKTNRAKEAILKARNWLIILVAALVVVVGAGWDTIIGINSLK